MALGKGHLARYKFECPPHMMCRSKTIASALISWIGCHHHLDSELATLSRTKNIHRFWTSGVGGYRCQRNIFALLALRWGLDLSLFTLFHHLAVSLLVTSTLLGSPLHHLFVLSKSIKITDRTAITDANLDFLTFIHLFHINLVIFPRQ